jgi:DNA modification methylase
MAIHIPEELVRAITDQEPVTDAPHNFYRYPARFSPHFARAAIDQFTLPGDVVLDPFCGGGTTIVEAVSLGRRVIGCDLNALAIFLARVKTVPLSRVDKHVLAHWAERIRRSTPTAVEEKRVSHDPAHYAKHLPKESYTFFAFILRKIGDLRFPRQRDFARLALLATGQSLLDCKIQVPSTDSLKTVFCETLTNNLNSHAEFLDATAQSLRRRRNQLNSLRQLIHAPSEEIATVLPASWQPVKLVLTSPPYPGVHVLYHRWQINGRRETPAAYWLANAKDGAGEAFYTLGRRQEAKLKTYFRRLSEVFSSVREVIDPDGVVVQLVAFSDASWQLPAFLEAMEAAGFIEETQRCDEKFLHGSRIWRSVPGRKWYANKRGDIPASREVLLVHKPRR